MSRALCSGWSDVARHHDDYLAGLKKLTVFIDTSAFYALASYSDEFHEKAKEHYRHLLEKNVTLFTSSP